MATRKPMKKFKRYDEGGPVEEAMAKQRGLDTSNKEAPVGFFERIRMGNIDQPGTEAYNRFGAGRGRATTPSATTAENKPQIVPRIPPAPRVPTPNEESGKLQNMISAGADIVGRTQNEGYRPNAGTASERAMLEGAFDSDKIIENTGPRTKPIVKTPVKPVASKPKAPAASTPATPAKPAEAAPATSQIPGQSTKAPQGGEKIDSSETERNINAALTATGLGGAAAGVYKLKKMYDASKAAKKALLKNPRLERPGTVTGKDFVVRDYEGAAKTASKGVPKKQLGYKKDTDVTDVTPKKASYRSETNPTKREDARADEARDNLKNFLTRDLDRGMKKGGSVKKYASGGMVSSASKRADGIASKGKTRCKIC